MRVRLPWSGRAQCSHATVPGTQVLPEVGLVLDALVPLGSLTRSTIEVLVDADGVWHDPRTTSDYHAVGDRVMVSPVEVFEHDRHCHECPDSARRLWPSDPLAGVYLSRASQLAKRLSFRATDVPEELSLYQVVCLRRQVRSLVQFEASLLSDPRYDLSELRDHLGVHLQSLEERLVAARASLGTLDLIDQYSALVPDPVRAPGYLLGGLVSAVRQGCTWDHARDRLESRSPDAHPGLLKEVDRARRQYAKMVRNMMEGPEHLVLVSSSFTAAGPALHDYMVHPDELALALWAPVAQVSTELGGTFYVFSLPEALAVSGSVGDLLAPTADYTISQVEAALLLWGTAEPESELGSILASLDAARLLLPS